MLLFFFSPTNVEPLPYHIYNVKLHFHMLFRSSADCKVHLRKKTLISITHTVGGYCFISVLFTFLAFALGS